LILRRVILLAPKVKFVVTLLQALRLLINLSCSDEMVAPLLAVSCTNGLRALLDPAAREEELLRYACSYISSHHLVLIHIVSLDFFYKSVLNKSHKTVSLICKAGFVN
jgi:hypothetical protein